MKVLMHVCCAPCFVYPYRLLTSEGVYVEGLFYNPNIHPEAEFRKRAETAEYFCRLEHVSMKIIEECNQAAWEAYTDGDRCSMCYSVRLGKAAKIARELKFDAFSTTLLVSPYQKHSMIEEIGRKLAEQNDVNFYYRDFRDGFRTGQNEARSMGLYRQKYCGCVHSHKSV